MEALKSQAQQFASGDHFDKDNISKKSQEVVERYLKLKVRFCSVISVLF